jgi:hypothetical protein
MDVDRPNTDHNLHSDADPEDIEPIHIKDKASTRYPTPEPQVSDLDALRATINPYNLCDTSTLYGAFMICMAVLKSFQDKIQLERLAKRPPYNPALDKEENLRLCQGW